MNDSRAPDSKIAQVQALLAEHRELFARQGSVAATWRPGGGRRVGPYFRLAYRRNGRQQSVYLGRCPQRAASVRKMIRDLQQPLQQQRQLERIRLAVHRSWRAHLRLWKHALAEWGLHRHGNTIRGWRRGLKRKVGEIVDQCQGE